MKLRAVLFGILIISLASIFALVAPASDVRADDVSEECTATINGVDVSVLNTPDNALEVDYDDILTVTVVAPSPFISHKVKMAFSDLFKWTVSDETDDGTETSYTTTVKVADYADFGTGLYKVTATGVLDNWDTCSTVAFINVGGEGFLSTVFGPIVLIMAILPALGLLLILLLIFLDKGPFGGGFGIGKYRMTRSACCSMALPLAVALTTVAMVTGGTPSPSSGTDEPTGVEDKPQAPPDSQNTSGRRIKFRPRISILSIGFALLSAIGFVLMFQQTGVAYPTITVVVLSLVLALVAGIVLPTLAQTFSRRRK
jgi:hypothetical protein